MQKKKILFYISIILSVVVLILLVCLFNKQIMPIIKSNNCMKKEFEKELISPFSINKIVYFSTANANSTINQNSSFTINDLYQITDIAIFINNNSNGNFNNKNTLKKVTLSNISFSLTPNIGQPNLYYKNLNDFAKNTFDINHIIDKTVEFETTSENEIDYNSPVLYNNSANPITLSYVNSNIITNYTLADTISNLSYDGSLLKTCNITLNSIACKIAINIIIENNLDEKFSCPVVLNIPLSTENSTIYDGKLVLTDNVDHRFIKMN